MPRWSAIMTAWVFAMTRRRSHGTHLIPRVAAAQQRSRAPVVQAFSIALRRIDAGFAAPRLAELPPRLHAGGHGDPDRLIEAGIGIALLPESPRAPARQGPNRSATSLWKYSATWHPARRHAMIVEKRRKQRGWRMSKPPAPDCQQQRSRFHTSLQADAACGHAEVKNLASGARLFAAFVACVAYAIWYFALSNLGSAR